MRSAFAFIPSFPCLPSAFWLAGLAGQAALACACDHPTAEHAVPAPSASLAPLASASAPAATVPDPGVPEASVAMAPPPPPPVSVENIGMHIGGGPNDAVTKAPIGTSVAPHMSELRACWSQVDPARPGDFGVDLLIPAEGGRAAVSNPRTNLGPQAFRDCVVAVFDGIDFARPRTGRTTVSYSLRFTPTTTPTP
jgi:hypothetical protein